MMMSDDDVSEVVSSHSLLLLQCEVPQIVNLRLARAARSRSRTSSSGGGGGGGGGGGVTVILDAGGEDRRMGREMLECVDYLIPNETELTRLAAGLRRRGDDDDCDDDGEEEGGGDANDGGGGGGGGGDGDECGWYGMSPRDADDVQARIGPSLDLRSILRSVRTLQSRGASNVLVTLGSRGSILARKNRRRRGEEEEHHRRSSSSSSAVVSSPPPSPSSSSSRRSMIIYQPPCPLPPGSSVVDETGAGDCYRAGFAVALLEHRRRRGGGEGGRRGRRRRSSTVVVIADDDDGDAVDDDEYDDDDDDEYDDDDDDALLTRCMEFASAAGALAVTRPGAVPSVPSRSEVEGLLAMMMTSSDGGSGSTEEVEATEEEEGGGGRTSTTTTAEVVPRGGSRDGDDGDFPFLFGSRINSMKDRIDLVSSPPPAGPRDYLRRQSAVRGLGCVDFNYPQHFEGHWTPEEAREALDEVGLVAGAVCLRYPSAFARGAMNHPDAGMRRRAIDITKRAADVARVLGCNE
jgi:hypothetical protein